MEHLESSGTKIICKLGVGGNKDVEDEFQGVFSHFNSFVCFQFTTLAKDSRYS